MKNPIIILMVILAQQAVETANAHDTHAQLRKKIVETAQKYTGTQYRYGGTGNDGFDCSGFVRHIYRKVGINLTRTSKSQYQQGKKISIGNAKSGDLVFYNIYGNGISHVGIYLGNNQFIHAPRQGRKVSTADMTITYWKKRFAGAVTYIENTK